MSCTLAGSFPSPLILPAHRALIPSSFGVGENAEDISTDDVFCSHGWVSILAKGAGVQLPALDIQKPEL